MPSIREEADRLAPTLMAWRRELHQWPELGFEELRTSAWLAARLREAGIEVRTGIARTGVVGILRSRSTEQPAILLRADMDALPIHEASGRAYGSKVPGCMHACGHDGHMAMLLGAATLLAARGKEICRDVVFCFQPAEEGRGGAKAMIEEGVLDIVETSEAYAIHLWSLYPTGTVHVRAGATMAAQDEFTARFVGKAGHGALPHQAVDPIVAAAQAVSSLQAVVARWVDPIEPAVVTVGSLHAGSAPNVIPEDARMAGTLRSFDENVRAILRDRVRQTLEGCAHAAGCRLEFDLIAGYPAVINTPAAVAKVRAAAADVVGEERLFEAPPMAAAEDFAYFLERRSGAFLFLGAGSPDRGINAPHHSPEFDIDESALPVGAALLARLALLD